jgi:hypothetical protein
LPQYILKPEKKFIPIRLGYFPRAFWEQWPKLAQMEQDAYILGWLARIEKLVDGLEKQVTELLKEIRNEADSH